MNGPQTCHCGDDHRGVCPILSRSSSTGHRLDIRSRVTITRSWNPWLIHAQVNPRVPSILLPHTRQANAAMKTPAGPDG